MLLNCTHDVDVAVKMLMVKLKERRKNETPKVNTRISIVTTFKYHYMTTHDIIDAKRLHKERTTQ